MWCLFMSYFVFFLQIGWMSWIKIRVIFKDFIYRFYYNLDIYPDKHCDICRYVVGFAKTGDFTCKSIFSPSVNSSTRSLRARRCSSVFFTAAATWSTSTTCRRSRWRTSGVWRRKSPSPPTKSRPWATGSSRPSQVGARGGAVAVWWQRLGRWIRVCDVGLNVLQVSKVKEGKLRVCKL